jgi:hypothetical protein
MKTIKWILAVSVLLNVFLSYKHVKRYLFEHNERKPFITYKYERDKLFEELPKDTSDIIFAGNSLTQHFELTDFFENTGGLVAIIQLEC